MTISIKPSRRGLLHHDLGVPEGKKIPAKALAKAEHSDSPAERKRAVFAENAKHWAKLKNPHGNPGYHPSTQGYEHESYEHTSKHR